MKRIAIVVCVLVAVADVGARACDLCAVYAATEAKGAKPGFSIGVFEQFTHFGTVQVDGKEVHNEVGQSLDSSITQIMLGYQFNERFGLQVNVPLIYRSFKRPEGFEIDRGTESGLGDMSLTGTFRVYERIGANGTFFWNVLGGVKFPTGNPHRLREELNEVEVPGAPESGIHGHDLALGSGSYDGIIGTSVFGEWKRLFASASVQYAIRSEGYIDYRYANDLTWSGGPGVYLWLGHPATLTLQLNVSGETKGKDTFQGERAEDTAITSVYLGPEIGFTWRNNLSAEIGVDIPVSQDNSALQVVPDYRLRAAATWRF